MAGCLKYGRKVYYQTAQSSLGCRTKAGRLAFRYELFHDLVDAEAGGFGAWREILEAFQPFRDKGLGSASEPNAQSSCGQPQLTTRSPNGAGLYRKSPSVPSTKT
jgi:hypothetical protein